MYEYILFFEDGTTKVTDTKEDWDFCFWPTVVRTWVTTGDYAIEYEQLSNDNEWVKIPVET